MIEREWIGRVPYEEALARQEARRAAIERGERSEVLWLLEHPPVITLGLRGGVEASSGELRGVPVVRTERGGLATYHGPGQLVGYLLVDLARHGWSVPRVVHGIEAGVARWLADRGVAAGAREQAPGVWVGERKICAIGLHVRRRHTMHGFALNLRTDLGGFAGFAPCGFGEDAVTSLLALTGQAPTPEQAAVEVAERVLHGIVGGPFDSAA